MKRFLLSVVLLLGVVSVAQALPRCYPGRVANVGGTQSLNAGQLSLWWVNHLPLPSPLPSGFNSNAYYVAFHASNEQCRRIFGNSAWATSLMPSNLNTPQGTINNGVTFQCQMCVYDEQVPVPEDGR